MPQKAVPVLAAVAQQAYTLSSHSAVRMAELQKKNRFHI